MMDGMRAGLSLSRGCHSRGFFFAVSSCWSLGLYVFPPWPFSESRFVRISVQPATRWAARSRAFLLIPGVSDQGVVALTSPRPNAAGADDAGADPDPTRAHPNAGAAPTESATVTDRAAGRQSFRDRCRGAMTPIGRGSAFGYACDRSQLSRIRTSQTLATWRGSRFPAI
jgi:hypothetical protein